MARRKSGFAVSLAALAAVGLSACAPRQESRPAATSGQGMSGMQGHQGHGMSGMQGHGMAGMDHQAMMAHCAEMRQQVRQGGRMSPDMQQMMAHCDQMDRSTGSQRPR